jgi:sarcosine oxidase subunit beta
MPRIDTDVAIIGGGIMGCSTALHLTLRGRKVVLLDRGQVGGQASGLNFGNVRKQGRFLPQLPLSLRAQPLWDRLPELVGADCEYAVGGNLLLAFSESEMAKTETYAESARAYGLELELLDAKEVRARYPWLTAQVYGASFSPRDAAANPALVTPAFARRARDLGAQILENTPSRQAGWDGTRFVIEAGADVEIRAEYLVNTSGAWAGKIASAFGEPVPLTASGPQLGITGRAPHFIAPTISVVGAPIYFRQLGGGEILFGGGQRVPVQLEPPLAEADPAITAAQVSKVVRIAADMAPYKAERAWSGVEGYLPDHIPVIGPSVRRPGLLHAFGFCGHGFQLGPAVGAVLSELIVDGRSSTPIDCFSIARFEEK